MSITKYDCQQMVSYELLQHRLITMIGRWAELNYPGFIDSLVGSEYKIKMANKNVIVYKAVISGDKIEWNPVLTVNPAELNDKYLGKLIIIRDVKAVKIKIDSFNEKRPNCKNKEKKAQRIDGELARMLQDNRKNGYNIDELSELSIIWCDKRNYMNRLESGKRK